MRRGVAAGTVGRDLAGELTPQAQRASRPGVTRRPLEGRRRGGRQLALVPDSPALGGLFREVPGDAADHAQDQSDGGQNELALGHGTVGAGGLEPRRIPTPSLTPRLRFQTSGSWIPLHKSSKNVNCKSATAGDSQLRVSRERAAGPVQALSHTSLRR